jgi:cytochrome c oxidase cbb3-type subunit 3
MNSDASVPRPSTPDTPHSPDPLLLDHEADGIRELDNKLPRWWVLLFYFTIIFSVVYLVYYHVLGAGDLMAAEYTKEMKRGDAIKGTSMAKFEADITTLQPSKDQVVLANGKQNFLKLCAPCHRADGGGLVGPNLTDDYWIHGDKFSDNVITIWNGVPQKGMVTWKGMLKPAEVYAVASYIYTLRGTKPPNPKPPENQAPVQTGPSPFE